MPSSRRNFDSMALWTCAAFAFVSVACGDDARRVDAGTTDPADAGTDAGPPALPVFPADFADGYREMRDCRFSHEHELRFIRVLASPDAQEAYAALSPDTPYPVGATLVKLEYDDEDCAVVIGYTAMRKLEPDANPSGGDWRWQRVAIDRTVTEDGAPWRCVQCHANHCAPPLGYDLTCAEEL